MSGDWQVRLRIFKDFTHRGRSFKRGEVVPDSDPLFRSLVAEAAGDCAGIHASSLGPRRVERGSYPAPEDAPRRRPSRDYLADYLI